MWCADCRVCGRPVLALKMHGQPTPYHLDRMAKICMALFLGAVLDFVSCRMDETHFHFHIEPKSR